MNQETIDLLVHHFNFSLAKRTFLSSVKAVYKECGLNLNLRKGQKKDSFTLSITDEQTGITIKATAEKFETFGIPVVTDHEAALSFKQRLAAAHSVLSQLRFAQRLKDQIKIAYGDAVVKFLFTNPFVDNQ
ncbi:hypothetical protein ACFBZI_11560 [Moraxella sp. ZJ142]|uniref:hypothetical protein n=1 Tax=Moraxella marmotae TaxID=3344520 RepID=UPI0035D51943